MKRNIAARPTTQPKATPRILAASAAALLALCLLPRGLSAATNSWTNTDNNQQWDDNNNWSTALKPVLTDDAVFPTPVPGSTNLISLSSSETANSLTFHNTYALTNGGAATLTLNPANGGHITVDPGFTAGVQVQVIGTSALNFNGGGTLSISVGANTYSGGTVLNSGTLDIDVLYVPNVPPSPPTNAIQSPLGTGTLTINGGTIGTGIGPTSLVPNAFSNGPRRSPTRW